jgi:hypothetical protein
MLAEPTLSDPYKGWDMSENNNDGVSPLAAMQIAQAVTNQKVEEVGRLVTELRSEVRELKTTFATKDDLKDVRGEVDSLKAWNKWVVQVIGGLILTAIIGMIVIKGGVPRP